MTNHGDSADGGVYTHELSSGESFSEGVVEAVAERSGSEPVPDAAAAEEPQGALAPLYTVLDPDALDDVFQATGADADGTGAVVRFRYHGHRVAVHSGGRITVD